MLLFRMSSVACMLKQQSDDVPPVTYRTQQQQTLSQKLRSVQGRQVLDPWTQLV